MIQLSWDQVTAWRLHRLGLAERAAPDQLLPMVRQIGALHAQVMSAAELQAAVRVRGITPQRVRDALWKTRDLIKTWVMRGTLHVIHRDDVPLYAASLGTLRHYQRHSWQEYFGVTADELQAMMDGMRVVLTDQPITREQLAIRLAEHTGLPKLRELLLSGWGSLLKPSAFRGDLCFGDSDGRNVTFVSPRAWIGGWEPLPPETALTELARRFLSTYGPATDPEFTRWYGFEPSAKKVLKTLGDQLVQVSVEGGKSWMLADDLDAIQQIQPPTPENAVRLLPMFDPYTLMITPRSDAVLNPEYRDKVYRAGAWISAIVIVRGRVVGAWETSESKGTLTLKINPFTPPLGGDVQAGIESEAARIGEFLGVKVVVQ